MFFFEGGGGNATFLAKLSKKSCFIRNYGKQKSTNEHLTQCRNADKQGVCENSKVPDNENRALAEESLQIM